MEEAMPTPSLLIFAIGALVISILCAFYLQLARRPKRFAVKGFVASFGAALGALAMAAIR